jgi:hypothetical protein
MVNLVHESEQASDFSLWKAFSRKPGEVTSGEVCNQAPLVLAKGHFPCH